MRVIKHVLPNGLAVVLVPKPRLRQAYVSLFFGVGSRHETPANNGITHVLEHMLFRGTKSHRTTTQLNAAAEHMGGYLEGATYRDHLVFATGCHPSRLREAVGLLSEIVLTPRYGELAVEKSILREEILEGLDERGNPIDIDNVAHETLFGQSGLGMPIEGSLENLKKITRKTLERHRREFIVGQNGVVAIAGPLASTRAVLAWVSEAFAEMPEGQASLSTTPAAGAMEPTCKWVRDPSSQVDLRLSFRAAPIHAPEYPALVMVSRVLADGLASRMHAELVDRQGLAYSLSAGLTTFADCGLFEFDVSVAPEKATRVVRAILDFAKQACDIKINREERQRVLQRYRYGLEFMGDNVVDLASYFGRSALFGIETQLGRLEKQLFALTDKQVQQAAQQVFRRQGMVLTAVGQMTRREWAGIKKRVSEWNP